MMLDITKKPLIDRDQDGVEYPVIVVDASQVYVYKGPVSYGLVPDQRVEVLLEPEAPSSGLVYVRSLPGFVVVVSRDDLRCLSE